MAPPVTAQIDHSWLVRATRAACLGLVHLFFRQIRATGLQHLPKTGVAIVVANHPNGLIDPVVLRIAAGTPLGFLAKSTLFGNPLGRIALAAFAGLPVYRPRDGADTSQNDRTFALARQRLLDGNWLALFPEGTSHSDPAMRPLKTGAARLALSFAEAHPLQPLALVPAGLLYEAKGTFRSAVAVHFGEPIELDEFARRHGTDFAAAQKLTAELHEALAAVVLQADSQLFLRGLLAVAAWTNPQAAGDLAVRQALAQSLAEAWQRLVANDQQAAIAIVERVRRFDQELTAAGIADPWQMDAPPPTAGQLFRGGFSLLAWLPLAVIGAVLGWPMYRAIRPLAERIAGTETDLVGTVKLLLGLLALPAWWAAEASAAGWCCGAAVALAVGALGPLCGYAALAWSERWDRRRQVLKTFWLRGRRSELAGQLRIHRDELVAAVHAALGQMAR